MPDPLDLLAVARLLSSADGDHVPSDAHLRRAVSTAYYALFHKILGAAAARFMGPDQQHTAGFALLYRGFDHRAMKEICEALQVSTLKTKYRTALRRSSVSQEMRDFAGIFPSLQETRHLADYDPAVAFLASDVTSLVDAAEVAMDAFDRAPPDERADILALMMVGARS